MWYNYVKKHSLSFGMVVEIAYPEREKALMHVQVYIKKNINIDKSAL